jgi:hypothetical protein
MSKNKLNNKSPRKQRDLSDSLDAPPSKAELEQLWSSKVEGVYYYCNGFSSHAEMAEDIVLSINSLWQMEGSNDNRDGKNKLTIVFTGRYARDLKRSMRRTFKQFKEQKQIEKRQERQEKREKAQKFWNRQVTPLLNKSKKGAA